MAILDTIRALIEKATHENTPLEEARTSALAACKLLKKHQILNANTQTVEKEESEVDASSYDDIPDFSQEDFFVEVNPFKGEVATQTVSCHFYSAHRIPRGLVYAKEVAPPHRQACWDCRHKFAKG